MSALTKLESVKALCQLLPKMSEEQLSDIAQGLPTPSLGTNEGETINLSINYEEDGLDFKCGNDRPPRKPNS